MQPATTQPKQFFAPHLSDHVVVITAVLRGLGVNARVLPKSNDRPIAIDSSFDLGRTRASMPMLRITAVMTTT